MTAGPAAITVRCIVAVGLLALFTACGDDPTSVTPPCDDARVLSLGPWFDATLNQRDESFAGSFIDYYAVELTDSADVTLTMTSSELDPLLLVFGEDGSVVEQAFQDMGSPKGVVETARLTETFGPGCHVLGASSWASGQTGAYRIRVQ